MRRGAILVLPTVTAGQQGPVAAWVSTAGWAGAFARRLGESWIVTPEGPVTAAEARRRASLPALGTTAVRHRRVPTVVKTAVKDLRDHRRATAFRVPTIGPWSEDDVAFVWQRHELFHAAGIELAAALGVPSVVFVPAPLVWQARQWGVRRPGWSRWAETVGEARPLRRADLVACGTDAVAEQVARLGVVESRLVVTPTGADPESRGEEERAAARA
ncbi:MAG: glycosyltransferase, partial [Actinomycetota bacterium]